MVVCHGRYVTSYHKFPTTHCSEVITASLFFMMPKIGQSFFNDGEAERKENLKNIQMIIEQEKAWGGIKFVKDLEGRFKTVFRVRKRGRPAKEQIK